MVLVATLGYVLLTSLAGMAGVVIYSYYSHLGCGPLAAGHVYSPNQVDNWTQVTIKNFWLSLYDASLIMANMYRKKKMYRKGTYSRLRFKRHFARTSMKNVNILDVFLFARHFMLLTVDPMCHQVISYYVADVLNFPGVPGLFIAALVAATFR